MALSSSVPGEEIYRIAIGQGMYSSELPSNIPDGFSSICYNLVATGDSLENRIGIKRPTLDWKYGEASPGADTFVDTEYYFCHIDPWSKDASKPAFMWSGKGYILPALTASGNTLNAVRAEGTHDANDGFMSCSIPNPCTGIAQYNGVTYFILSGVGVQKITVFNWATDTITYTQVASSAGATMRGLFTFKDRLWAWNKHNLYFTNVASVTNPLPETWALASNVIPFAGPNGYGDIKQIVPLGNRLAVFTTNGLFTLLVEGEPASWIMRILDSKSICTTSRTAFESKGIIYYINSQGVWATNTQTVTKLSAVIDDQWFLAKGARIHTICAYEDGMIASIAKQSTTNGRYFDKDNCKVFYSKLDPIGWTEWNINQYEASGGRPDRYAFMWSTTDKIPTYLNAEPSVYIMGMITDSTQAANTYGVMQVLIMDGGSDEYVDRSNTLRTSPVGIYLKTKHFDGGNPYSIKRAKQGMLEIFTSDANHVFTTSWDLDETIDSASEVEEVNIQERTVGVGSNLVRIRNQIYYRRAAMNVRTTLQSDTSQIKIKDIAIAQDTGRGEFEIVR